MVGIHNALDFPTNAGEAAAESGLRNVNAYGTDKTFQGRRKGLLHLSDTDGLPFVRHSFSY